MRTVREAHIALGVCTASLLILLLAGRGLSPNLLFLGLAMAYAGLGLYLLAARHLPDLRVAPLLAAGGLLMLAAVVRPPLESDDVWSYAAYGRMVAHHHESPWAHVPAEHPHDPYTSRVDARWRHTPSAYGPAFVAPAALVMAVARSDPGAARVGFQVLALLSVAAALWLIGRETRWAPGPLALIGLNPLIVLGVVNSGHNDAWCAALLLGAVVLARRGRWVAVGALVAAATLVKITAGLALLGLIAWVWRRAGRAAAFRMAATTAVLAGLGFLVAGGPTVVRGIARNSSLATSSSVWSLAPRSAPSGLYSTLALVGVVAFAAFLVAGERRDVHPAVAVALGLTSYYLVGAFVWPWYVVWGLAPLALCWRSRTAGLLVALGMLLELTGAPIVGRVPYVAAQWYEPVRWARLLDDVLPYLWLGVAAALLVSRVVRWRSGHTSGRDVATPPFPGPLAAGGGRPA